MDGTELAPEGQAWVCLACGKTSRSRFGLDKGNKNVAMKGWDASCVLNSQLIQEDWIVETENGLVRKIDVPDQSAA